MLNRVRTISLPLLIIFYFTSVSIASDNKLTKQQTNPILKTYCIDCHGPTKKKGNIHLHNLEELPPLEQEKILNKIEEQIYLEHMPPKAEDQPISKEREILFEWIHKKFRKLNIKSNFRNKLLQPNYGNYVNHEKLFSGELKDKAYTPARRWIISPYIFENKIREIFKLKNKDNLPKGLVNPIHLPDVSGVRYYDNQVVNSGHFLTMLRNAEIISYAQLGVLSAEDIEANHKKDELYKLALKEFKRNPKQSSDKKALKKLEASYAKKEVLSIYKNNIHPTPFDIILRKKSHPTDQEISKAILFQYSQILYRKPSSRELIDCIELTKNAIRKAGITEGLRAMLVAVILKPEFLYRSEFGQGRHDAYGRRKLSPKEASYAIAYALTERIPDPLLRNAAETGELQIKKDYKHHIQRLLAKQYEPQMIDQRLKTKHTTSYYTSQLVKLRFFREFFGYSKAYQIFKDDKRFEGKKYKNGIKLMINDADLMVDKILEKDKNVFHELLSTEKFYLYHNGDNGVTQKAVQDLKTEFEELYQEFNTTKLDAFVNNNKKVLAKRFNIKGKKLKKTNNLNELIESKLKRYSNKNYNPIVYAKNSRYRTGADKNLDRVNLFNYDHLKWSFVSKQPFAISNRKGILTHPVWLIAHSLNTSTDPVKRGKWIREKLLAGTIPDVPISVDAAIPEDHHKTLRDRLHLKTQAKECWKCHKNMNPLGYAFEMYDDFGRYRKKEELEYPEHLIYKAPDKGDYTRNKYKTLPLNTKGALSGSGDKSLDGEVDDAIDLINRLSQSDRVRQSIIRHAFRYFLGRNEMLSDSQTLIDADQAYLNSGGSFNAVITSLLTSDSFMYRK